MRVVDLTLLLYDGMPVYPGDPETKISLIQTYEKDDWNMRRLEINSHDGTHLNVPIHATRNGKNLDEYQVEDFFGPCVVYQSPEDLQSGIGIIFSEHDIDQEIAEQIVKVKPKFIGLSERFEFNVKVERYLLEKGIISFEKLANTDKLPKNSQFMFYGFPLKIKNGDGSPVRAVAVIED